LIANVVAVSFYSSSGHYPYLSRGWVRWAGLLTTERTAASFWLQYSIWVSISWKPPAYRAWRKRQFRSVSKAVLVIACLLSSAAPAWAKAKAVSRPILGRRFIVLIDDSGRSQAKSGDKRPAIMADLPDRLFGGITGLKAFDPRQDRISVLFFTILDSPRGLRQSKLVRADRSLCSCRSCLSDSHLTSVPINPRLRNQIHLAVPNSIQKAELNFFGRLGSEQLLV